METAGTTGHPCDRPAHANGDVLVLGRNVDEAGEISHVVGQALALGLLAGLLSLLLAGAWLSVRAQKRVERSTCGSAHHRRRSARAASAPQRRRAVLETCVIVNGMLDEWKPMIHALAGVGNDIATA